MTIFQTSDDQTAIGKNVMGYVTTPWAFWHYGILELSFAKSMFGRIVSFKTKKP